MKKTNATAYNLRGKECTLSIGDKVRAWDFEPREGFNDAYVEGTFIGFSYDNRLTITVEKDTLYPKGHRTEILTPQTGNVIFGEWNGRITSLEDDEPKETTKKLPHYFTVEQVFEFEKMSDKENPTFTFRETDAKILSMIVNDKIDAKAMAWKELANRGLDHCGEWVGFDQAHRIFESSVCTYLKM